MEKETVAFFNEGKSMAVIVYDHLKQAILFHRIAPGTQLVEKNIGEKLNVSRTPIRKAMTRLQNEGLVKIIPNRGAFVVEPTSTEIQQAFRMRSHLEKMSVELIFNQMTTDDLLELKELVDHERETYQTKDILEYLEVNKQFHMLLALKTKNSFLIEFTERMLNQINVYLMLYDVFSTENLERQNRFKEHQMIINAFEKEDLEQLLALVDQHMDESLHYMSLAGPSSKTSI